VTSLQKDKSDRDNTILSLNAELQGRDSIIASKDRVIASKNEEIDWLHTFSNSTLGYFRVNTYGFAFDYPFNFNLSVTGLRDASANTDSGVIGMKRSDVEYISIAYAQWDTLPNLDETLDLVLSSISNLNPTVGPRVTSSMSGYPLKYQTVSISASGETGYGVYGYAYCTKLGYYFGMVVFSASETQTMEWFNHIFDTFALPQ